MSFANKLMQAYFNYAYNPVYDFATARLNRYRKLQESCIGKLEFEDKDRVLCVGLGTGNEVFHILRTNASVSIVGIDYSHTALQKAYKKALRLGREIEVLIMDARSLDLANGSFDKVLCIHVMDFVEENEKVTDEILRVLKDGGQFVITYPSEKEGARLGLNLLKDGIRHNVNSRKNRIKILLESLAQMLVGIVYLPLLFRPKRKSYSRRELEAMITRLTTADFQIEEDSVYQDFIVYGRKLTEGG
ncbi:2-methoxy-6-polyprenyl-1,4-benzoquinol methylase [subsurface metagenome]